MSARLFGFDARRFHQNDPGDDLQAICNSVLHFNQHDFLLSQQLVLFALQGSPFRDILYAKEDGIFGACFVGHLTGIQKHRARSNVGKFVLDLIALHDVLLGDDLLQQHAKLGNVPLSVAQRVKKPALRILGPDLEIRIKGTARGNHAKSFVEHQDRLADSVDNALSKRPSIRDIGELVPEVGCLHQTLRYALGKQFRRVKARKDAEREFVQNCSVWAQKL